MKKNTAYFIVAAIIVAIVVGVFLENQNGASKQKSLTIVSFGGAYQAAQRKAYMEPYSQQSGTQIVEGEYNGEYGVISQRSTSTKGSWDVVSVESAPALRGQQEGIFAPIPKRVYDGLPIIDAARRTSAAGHLLFSTILGYRMDLKEKPTSWKDFWDLEHYPGKRGLRNNPRGTLEIALVADGISPNDLYPLDVERALSKLDTIREDIVFWESGAQPIQLLANEAVVMTSVYNGRIWDAKVNEKLPFGWILSGGLLEVEYWVVPKNSDNKEKAFDFIRFSLQSGAQAEFANIIAYIPTNSSAMSAVSADIKMAMPDTQASGDQVIVNAQWWSANQEKVSARWEAWLVNK